MVQLLTQPATCGTLSFHRGDCRYVDTSYSIKYTGRTGRGRVTGRSMNIARAVLLDKASYSDVARRYGVSKQRVGQIVRRMGIARKVDLNAERGTGEEN